MKLHHLHLPNLTPYPLAASLQTHLTNLHLPSSASIPHHPAPPYLLTFTPPPTYTTGRRDLARLTPPQIAHLRAGGTAEFYEALRGGQTTFHGPGQTVGYVILTLKRHGLGVRSHVELLEEAGRGVVGRFGVRGWRWGDRPGVWVGGGEEEGGGGRKIVSVGVRMRRGVASHGVGINVETDLGWFERIEACGLPGSRVTSLRREVVERQGGEWGGFGVGDVAGGFAEEVAGRLGGVEGVVDVGVEDVGFVLGEGLGVKETR